MFLPSVWLPAFHPWAFRTTVNTFDFWQALGSACHTPRYTFASMMHDNEERVREQGNRHVQESTRCCVCFCKKVRKKKRFVLIRIRPESLQESWSMYKMMILLLWFHQKWMMFWPRLEISSVQIYSSSVVCGLAFSSHYTNQTMFVLTDLLFTVWHWDFFCQLLYCLQNLLCANC